MQKTITLRTDEELENEVQMLKAKYDKTYTITINLNDDGEEYLDSKRVKQTRPETCNCIFRGVDRNEYSQIQKLYRMDVIYAIEYFVKTCHIGGDTKDIVVGNDYALRSMELPFQQLLVVQPSVLVDKAKGLIRINMDEDGATVVENGEEYSVPTTKDCYFRLPNRQEYPILINLFALDLIGAIEHFIKTFYVSGEVTVDELIECDYALRGLDLAIGEFIYTIPSKLKKN